MKNKINYTKCSHKKQVKGKKQQDTHLAGIKTTIGTSVYLVNTRMRSKRDIKMGRLCTPKGGGGRGESSELSNWGMLRSVFLNGEAIPDENVPFYVRLYALVVVLKILLDFRLWSKSYGLSEKKRSLWVPPAYS